MTSPPSAETAPLSKYERTYVIGVRAEQLARGAQAFVDLPAPVTGKSAVQTMYAIAERELDARVLPLTIVRKLADGSTVNVPLSGNATGSPLLDMPVPDR